MYKSKYLITEDRGEIKGHEMTKMVNSALREANRITPFQIITAILIASLIVYLFIR